MGKKQTGRNFAIGTLFAAGLGYLAGILTAPKSGRETRKEIHDKAAQTKSDAEKKLKVVHSELSEAIDQGKRKAKDVSEATKAELVEALGKAQVAKEKARNILSAVHEGGADDKDLQKAINEANAAIDHLKLYIRKDAAEKAK